MDLIEEVKNKQIVLVVLPKTQYTNKLIEVVKAVDVVSNKVCYVCLNKPYNSIIDNLKANNLDLDKYFFIDVLTSTVKTPEPTDNCEFVQSPSALTDISLAFTKAVQEMNCNNVLFDAISTLTIYQDIGEIIKFTQNLMTKARVSGVKSVYIALKEDSDELVKDLTMFVDGVVELG
ncbi:hypothetical protein AYK26_03815 [Euryarchaeota archaeon SM23-78]|nr:MAG: hypothetical protein AYK26_03815 [Euryarchaeota archaeon SM23-78]MBW3001467.1 hypothetical protein [Candidatus Woesearchaeota archaeon]